MPKSLILIIWVLPKGIPLASMNRSNFGEIRAPAPRIK
jgi:hypothetical protein